MNYGLNAARGICFDGIIEKVGLENTIVFEGYNYLIGRKLKWVDDRPIEILPVENNLNSMTAIELKTELDGVQFVKFAEFLGWLKRDRESKGQT